MKFTKNVLDTLPGIIPGGISAQDFSVITKIDVEESKKILENFFKKWYRIKTRQINIILKISDKLKTALMLIETGSSS